MADHHNHLVMEEREECMISPTGSHSVILRTAHFLKPSATSPVPPLPRHPPFTKFTKYKDLPFKPIFRGWKHQHKDWKEWVGKMHALHYETWKRAGILEAVMNSTFTIHRNDDLIFAFVEKWCSETNTFVFPWGEATITLEDMMELGGYPVLGDSVLSPTGDSKYEKAMKKLTRARAELNSTKAKKAAQNKWKNKFKDSGSEAEHEAFLALWLSRFVFPIFSEDTIGTSVLPAAVKLARGWRVALGPAVLACIYRSLGQLKVALTSARRPGVGKNSSVHEVTVSAPLALVQAWIWERFPGLRPVPKSVGQDEPRLARWDNLKKMDVKNIMKIVDDSTGSFEWRPYRVGRSVNCGTGFYNEDGYWVLVDLGSNDDEEVEGFVRCLRTSELVGLEPNCIEQYLPNRVAMQFGLDQDVPGVVERDNDDPETAWSTYNRPIADKALYVPPRVSEPGVTSRYLKWWKDDWSRLNETSSKEIEGFANKDSFGSKSENEDDFIRPSFASSSKKKKLGAEGSSEGGANGKIGTADFEVKIREDLIGRESEEEDEDYVPPPPGFPPKRKRVHRKASDYSRTPEQFHEEKFASFSSEEIVITWQTIAPTTSTAKNGAKIQGSGESSLKNTKRRLNECLSRKLRDSTDRVSPPPGFAPKETLFSGQSSFENIHSPQGTHQVKYHASSEDENRYMNDQEKLSSAAAESGHKNKAAAETSRRSPGKYGPEGGEVDTTVSVDVDNGEIRRISETLGMELEERITRLQMLCDLLKAGK